MPSLHCALRTQWFLCVYMLFIISTSSLKIFLQPRCLIVKYWPKCRCLAWVSLQPSSSQLSCCSLLLCLLNSLSFIAILVWLMTFGLNKSICNLNWWSRNVTAPGPRVPVTICAELCMFSCVCLGFLFLSGFLQLCKNMPVGESAMLIVNSVCVWVCAWCHALPFHLGCIPASQHPPQPWPWWSICRRWINE